MEKVEFGLITDAAIKRNLDQLKEFRELSDNGKLGCYIITKGKPLNKYEQIICRIIPNSLYAESLWYKANGTILGQADDTGNIRPFTLEI